MGRPSRCELRDIFAAREDEHQRRFDAFEQLAHDFRLFVAGDPTPQVCLDRVEVGVETEYKKARELLARTTPSDQVVVDLDLLLAR